MTQEEKAKAYDEALERAKETLRKDCSKSTIYEVEHIFPELKESEDERIRKILIESFEKANCSKVDEFVNCKLNKGEILSYLEKQERFNLPPKQEWSEEDEDMRYKATAILNKLCASKKEFVWQPETLIKIFNWFKSLRPSWKPSKEQIEALWELMHYAVYLANWNEFEKPIESLYNDLKKL